MLKSILLFIKAHIVSTTIMTIIVVSAAVVTPIAIESYKTYQLDKTVQAGLSMLGKADNLMDNEISNNSNNNTVSLTFRVERIKESTEDIHSVEYKIIPSYDKDYSEWTKSEKELYEQALEEARQKSEEEYNSAVASEQQAMDAIWQKAVEEMSNDWKKQDLGSAGSLEYCIYTARVRGTILGESFDVSFDEFVNNIAPTIQTKLDKRRPVPKSETGDYYFGDDGIPIEEADKIYQADNFESVTKTIKDNLELRKNEE